MTLTDAELISQALNMQANYLETGNVLFSANEADMRNKSINTSSRLERRNFVPLKTLSQDEVELVARLRTLAFQPLKSSG